jgi:subtilase family serine protease
MNTFVICRHALICVTVAIGLTACGGGGADVASSVSDITSSTLDVATLSNAEAAALAVPFVTTAGTTEPSAIAALSASPYALNATSKVYTPAQIRLAYQLPALPTSWSNVSAGQAAQYGAGQTIYIVDAMHDPNVTTELSAFNQKFGLPSCTTTTVAVDAALPLAAASSTKGCELLVVYSQGSAMTSSPPVYDSGWASEIALDVQWAHATAPLARIVLIEAPDASVGSLMGAISLANAMGPGVVSMSFGTPEGSWMTGMDSVFSNANMTYVAATGDSGAGVSWPSASAQVLAVGGASLNGYTNASRNETTWSLTGGGVSGFVSAPTYQSNSVPGIGSQTMRNVADVSFNADPATGQYTAIIPAGSSTVRWYSVGGTSLATPQWAGVVAVTNATRAQNSQGPLGLVQNFLYQAASSTANFFTTVFNDIVNGSNGGYSAHAYYDLPTGLGTPNVSSFMSLGGGSTASTGTGTVPVVTPVAITGTSGSPISFSVAYTSSNAVTWTLSNAPSGMGISSTGLISWDSPVVGVFSLMATATDTVSHLSGSALIKVTVNQPSIVPIVSSATVAGQAGVALSYQVNAQSSNKPIFSLAGNVPVGVAISSTGVLTWSRPVAGNYSVTTKVTDSKTGAVGTGVVSLQIASAATLTGPVITASDLTGTAGTPLTGVIGISDPGARSVQVNAKGAPAGMSFASNGQGILLKWKRPVAGVYTLVITATDNNLLTTQAKMTITIN